MKLAASLLALAGLAAASPFHVYRATNSSSLPAKTIFQFNETGTWLENVAVRPNGDLLLTMLSPSASLWTLKKPYAPDPEMSLVHRFQGGEPGLVGIAETTPDVFVLVAADFVAVGEPAPGSYAVWEVSLRGGAAPAVRKVADFPEARLANGAAHVPGGDVVLVADSFAGALWRLDTRTGRRESVLAVPEMAAPPAGALPIGINGLKVHGGYAYWSNSAAAAIYRARIGGDGYPVANATVETVAELDSPFVDDFAFDSRGLLWAATNSDNKVDVVRPDGTCRTMVGGAAQDTVAGDSAVAFGRTPWDRSTFYVTTSGALPGNRTEPAKVVAVNRAGFR
ncbi:hypothetical protein F4804DRAFT_344045 [Jackrogersella minutella]|nr:hypothetical protein F4804DRAFT_344045 [Jackrogersella minutella]